MIVGYARVSTACQRLDAQHSTLRGAGAERLFAEKQSGAKTDRAALTRCLASLEPGGTLLVPSLIGWRGARGTCSTPSPQSQRLEQPFDRWVILGRTLLLRMGDSC
jgi:hypothetical protein